ncbi:tRNA(Ile)-lysidine synthetase, partial [Mycobacterium rufum]|nr:tRNA(Ile)-lysidine synthetase [Mycolicibacterium rufum]
MDRPGAVAQLRAALLRFAGEHLVDGERWCVALSGGPDSLALTAVAATLRPTTALIVDHGLQAGSPAVAATARDQALTLRCVAAQVLCVDVGTEGGPEAAARGSTLRPPSTAGPGRVRRYCSRTRSSDQAGDGAAAAWAVGSGARSIGRDAA